MSWTTANIGDICENCAYEFEQDQDAYEAVDGLYCEGCYDDGVVDQFDDDDPPIDGVGFADPGGESALRAETSENPRTYSCPTCGRENMLTRIDVQNFYQCNLCSNVDERGW